MQQNHKIDEIQDQIEGSVLKERFTIGRLIDCGSFGKVYLVKKRDCGQYYAMKALKKAVIIKHQ